MNITKLFYVYKITNLINNKIYIGKTSGEDPSVRFYNHKKFPYYKSSKNDCPKLYNSIRKYGAENFSFEILETFEDEVLAYAAEDKYVIKFDSLKNGLNTVPGGWGTMSGSANPMYGKGYLIAGERNGMYGRTDELNPFYGKKHSEEVLANIKLINRVLSDETVIAIKQMIKDKVNYNEIAEKFDINLSSISRIKLGKRYADVGEDLNIQKYNRTISEEKVEEILHIWFKNPILIGNRRQIKTFFDKEVEGKYNISLQILKAIFRGSSHMKLFKKIKEQYENNQ